MRLLAIVNGKVVAAFERAGEAAEWAHCQVRTRSVEDLVRQIAEAPFATLIQQADGDLPRIVISRP